MCAAVAGGARIKLFSERLGAWPCVELQRVTFSADAFRSRSSFGERVIEGSYLVRKLSARGLVEEGIEGSGRQYVRVYTVDNSRGGDWQETDVTTGERTVGTFVYDR